MKKVLFLLAIVCITFITSNSASAQTKLIHFWHFNNYTTSDYVPVAAIKADYSRIDTNKAQIIYSCIGSPAYTTYADSYYAKPADLDTFNARFVVAPGIAFRTRNPSDSMELLFYMPTTHYKNIVLKYATEASNGGSGPKRQDFHYSVDSGATWRTAGLSIPNDSALTTAFKLVTVAFSDSQVNSNPKFVFKITFNGNTTGTSGNNRFDNVSLDGDTLITTGVTPIAVETFEVFPNPSSSQITVTTSSNGAKAVNVTDLNGKMVIFASVSGNKFPVNIANLNPGMYFITVTDENTGNRNFARFIKQ